MKRWIVLCVVLVCTVGCQGKPREGEVLAKVNNYVIGLEEFEQLFREANFGKEDTLEARKEYLKNLVKQKLVLQDAQAKGIDKQAPFLRSIERFWEQSLARIAIDVKATQLGQAVVISDKEVQQEVESRRLSGREESFSQVHSDLLRAQEDQRLKVWLDDLYTRADIQVNDTLLKKDR